jgi:hypothetical protein
VNWNTIAQAIIIAVGSAVALTGLIALTKFIRSVWLKRRIANKLSKTTIGSGLVGITTIIRNESQVEWRVREVSLSTPGNSFKFNPIGDESDTAASHAELFGQRPPRSPQPTPQLLPLSGYEYGIPAAFMTHYEGPALGLSIRIDYKTYSGRWKSLVVQTDGWANDLIQKTMQHYKQEFENGSLAAARVRFGMDAARRNWNVPRRRVS